MKTEDEMTRTDRALRAIGWRAPELVGIGVALLLAWLVAGWLLIGAIGLAVWLIVDVVRDRAKRQAKARRAQQRLTGTAPAGGEQATGDAAEQDGGVSAGRGWTA